MNLKNKIEGLFKLIFTERNFNNTTFLYWSLYGQEQFMFMSLRTIYFTIYSLEKY